MKGEKKPAKGRSCKVCKLPDIKQINSRMTQGTEVPYRKLEMEHPGVSKTSFARHARRCLGRSVANMIEQGKIKQGIDVVREFEDNLAFAKRLRVAAEEYLADPNDPLRFQLIPRSDEIDVTFFDHTDFTEHNPPRPKKKTAKLSLLLASVEEIRNIEVDKVNIKHVDLRSFALDAIDAVDKCIDKFAKLRGLYQRERENEKTFHAALESYELWKSLNPQATDEERAHAIGVIARGGQVSERELAHRAGVPLVSEMSQ